MMSRYSSFASFRCCCAFSLSLSSTPAIFGSPVRVVPLLDPLVDRDRVEPTADAGQVDRGQAVVFDELPDLPGRRPDRRRHVVVGPERSHAPIVPPFADPSAGCRANWCKL